MTTTNKTISSSSTSSFPTNNRVILLLDLDSFYAQCECVRLGLDARKTPLALFQWNSVLAVTYPARRLFDVKRGDSWETVALKSKQKHRAAATSGRNTNSITDITNNTNDDDDASQGCLGVHVPILVTSSSSAKDGSSSSNNNNTTTSTTTNNSTTTTTDANKSLLEQDYAAIYQQSPQQQLQARQNDIGLRHYSSQGKACIERYRVASAKIFETVLAWIEQHQEQQQQQQQQFQQQQQQQQQQQPLIILERASIDEFYLDVTRAVQTNEEFWKNQTVDVLDEEDTAATTTTTITTATNEEEEAEQEGDEKEETNTTGKKQTLSIKRALQETVHIGAEKRQHEKDNYFQCNNDDDDYHGNMDDDIDNIGDRNDDDDDDDKRIKQLIQRGCWIARSIRQAVWDKVGFTLSSGISINKTIAKLSASYGKPDGQAVTFPTEIPYLLQHTQIRKCRNFGGKLGQKVQALLPPEAPTTMDSIRKYLSLPVLQNAFTNDPATARWVYEAARGVDRQAVNSTNDNNNNNNNNNNNSNKASHLTASITAFKSLPTQHLVSEATSWIRLVAQDVVLRVEKDLLNNRRYPRSCHIQYSANRGRQNKSLRTHFPPECFATEKKVQDLVDRVPRIISKKEGGDCKLHRVGLCAVDFFTKSNAMEQYLVAVGTGGAAVTVAKKGAKEDHSAGVLSTSVVPPPAKDSPTSTAATQQANGTTVVQNKYSQSTKRARQQSSPEDADLALAKKLQANYDRETRLFRASEARRSSFSSSRPAPSKTRRIDSFFRQKKP